MSDAVVIALIAAIPSVVSAIAAAMAVRSGNRSLHQSRVNTAAIAEVHSLANNNLNAANDRLDTALDKITELQRKKP